MNQGGEKKRKDFTGEMTVFVHTEADYRSL